MITVILIGCMINTLIGVLVMNRHDDGTVIEWCFRFGFWAVPVSCIAAFCWPIGLYLIYRKR